MAKNGIGDQLVLTDDEMVALAADLGAPRAMGLPTVDAADPGQLDGASFRGHRSLFVRGLLDQAGRPVPEVADAWRVAATAPGVVEVYLGDDDLNRVGWTLSSLHHVGHGSWLLEKVSAVGIHRLAERDADEHRQYVEALIRGAFEAGPAPVAPADPGPAGAGRARPGWLCVAAASEAGVVRLAVRKGELRWHEDPGAPSEPEFLGVEVTPVGPTEPVAAARHLMEAASRVGQRS